MSVRSAASSASRMSTRSAASGTATPRMLQEGEDPYDGPGNFHQSTASSASRGGGGGGGGSRGMVAPASPYLSNPRPGGGSKNNGGGLPAIAAGGGGGGGGKTSAPTSPRVPRKPNYSPRSQRQVHSARATLRSAAAAQTASAPDAGHENSTKAILAQLDSERRRYEAAGRYLEAQDCLDALREITAAEGRKIIKETTKQNIQSEGKEKLLDEHRRQLMQFSTLWEETLQNYNTKAERSVEDLLHRHRREFEEQEELIRTELAAKRQKPHFTKTVLHLRAELHKLVELNKYREADAVQKQLEVLEAKELRSLEEQLSLQFAARTKQLKRKAQLEVRTLEHRIETGRDALLAQRRSNYEMLLQRQMNAVSSFEQKGRTGAAREQQALTRQLDAMLASSTKTKLTLGQPTLGNAVVLSPTSE